MISIEPVQQATVTTSPLGFFGAMWELGIEGTVIDINATVTAVSDSRVARWSCVYFGTPSGDVPVQQTVGGDLPWSCAVVREGGKYVVRCESGDDTVRWFLDGRVRQYADWGMP
jgi:hypothetical protein